MAGRGTVAPLIGQVNLGAPGAGAEPWITLFTAVVVAALGFAVPLVWVALRGYADTPWGRVIAPLPWIVGALLVWGIVALLPLSIWLVGSVAAVTWGIATVGLALVGLRTVRLFTGRVKL